MINESYVGKQLEALKSRVSILENQMADLLRQDENEVCMTNEEAIEILKSKMDGSVDPSYEFGEAVRMAIRALKEQKTYSEMTKPIKEDTHEEKTDLCKTCKKGDDCELSTKMFSGTRTTQCYRHDEVSKILNDKITYMCEECHSESYSNGFDSGYKSGKEDAQNSSLGDEVETVETNEQFNRIHSGYAEGWQQGYAEGYRDGYKKGRRGDE